MIVQRQSSAKQFWTTTVTILLLVGAVLSISAETDSESADWAGWGAPRIMFGAE